MYDRTIPVGDEPHTDEFYTTWTIMECPVCRKPTVLQTESSTFDVHPVDGSRETTEVLYPTIRTRVINLAESVEKVYRSALKVRYVEPAAFAVQAGRTLEVVCQQERAQGRSLAHKLNSLAISGRIPETLAQTALQLKEIRNLGAHADGQDEVTEADVLVILDFLEAILEYLYVVPANSCRRSNPGSGETQRIKTHPCSHDRTKKGRGAAPPFRLPLPFRSRLQSALPPVMTMVNSLAQRWQTTYTGPILDSHKRCRVKQMKTSPYPPLSPMNAKGDRGMT